MRGRDVLLVSPFDETRIDDLLWEMSENRIDELACDPEKARAYLAERSIER
jgi:hypothetical protein